MNDARRRKDSHVRTALCALTVLVMFLVGTTDSQGPSDFLTVAFDASARDVLWVATYDSPDSMIDRGWDVAVSPDATRVFVTGESVLKNPGPTGGDTPDYVTVAYDAISGQECWVARYAGPGGGDKAAAIVVSPDGRSVIVTGESYDTTDNHDDVATVAYDAATGAELWVARYDRPVPDVHDQGVAIDMSPDGARVTITARSEAGSGQAQDYLTLAYGSRTGELLWEARYDGPDHGYDQPGRVVAGPNGDVVFVTGRSGRGDGGFDLATVAYDALRGTELWVRRHAASLTEAFHFGAAGVALDGHVLVVTSDVPSAGGGTHALTVAYEVTTGFPLWRALFMGPEGASAIPHALAVDPDGTRLVIAGELRAAEGEPLVDTLTVCYDAATGAELWNVIADSPAGLVDRAKDVTISPDGSHALVASVRQGAGGSMDFALDVHSLRSGAALGSRRYDALGSGHDTAYDVALTPDGATVLVAGNVNGAGPSEDETIALDAATGRLLWTARFADQVPTWANATGVAVAPNGRTAYVAGQEGGGWAANGVAHLVALDSADGAKRWHARHNTPDLHSTVGVVPASDGTAVFMGVRDGPLGGGRYLTLAYDSETGHALWSATYTGPVGPGEFPFDLDVSADGAVVFMTGESLGAGGLPDAVTVANDAVTGEQLWVSRHDAGLSDRAFALATSPDSRRVYVTGSSQSVEDPQDFDFLTVAYDVGSGSELWVAHYDGPYFGPWPVLDDDRATAVITSLDGRVVFVAGTSHGVGTGSDFAVVAYDALTGEQRMVARFDGPHGDHDRLVDLALGRDGQTVLLCGTAATGQFVQGYPSVDSLTVAFDAESGALSWSGLYAAPLARTSLTVGAMVADIASGSVFVAGGSEAVGTHGDFTVLAYVPRP